MATFQFRLERVLEWYRTQLQLEENRLAVCLAALNRVEERIARLQAERLGVEREVIASAKLAARDLTALGLYRLQAKKQTAVMEEERTRRERARREQTAAVQRAQRRVRLVEKLRERRLSEHLYIENRALETLASEAYLSKWIAERR